MELFSQRKGIKPVKSIMQLNSMDNDLRNSLWNALTLCYWNKVSYPSVSSMDEIPSDISSLIKLIWRSFYKFTLDTMNYHWKDVYGYIKSNFFYCKWHECYDFIEFIANNYGVDKVNIEFMNFCNSILKEELSAYRFVGGKITQITSDEEIAEIEKARIPISPVREHINRALELLSDRKSPDYRNSIKESISAVEAICKLIADDEKATLGDALKAIGKVDKVKMHTALGHAFSSLYGWTNDASGIRHALMNEPNLYFEDAKFMLVSCSAFINYLRIKSSKAGINYI